MPIDPTDVQGLVRFAYKRQTEACYLLLRIRDAKAARAWCVAAPVGTAAVLKPPPAVSLQVAFTGAGLRALGVPERVVAGFSPEFLSGMAGEPSRSRRLGDVGENAPEGWLWGAPGKVPDVLVMLFAEPGKLADWQRTVQDAAWHAAFELMARLDTSDLGGVEPFGFADGISQPLIDWDSNRKVDGEQIAYGNLVAAGEFILGYRNEYGKYTARPLLDKFAPAAADLLSAEDVSGRRDVARNGTYLVLRVLEQDVRGFWQFVDTQANDNGDSPNPDARRKLAEAMVGRGIHGEPLVPLSANTPGNNHFTYDADPAGTRCPFGAHIRRANPRNADSPNRPRGWFARLRAMLGFGSRGIRSDLMASTRFHRLLRRGREYGPALPPDLAISQEPDHHQRGLNFICLNANIARQFEFVQNAWLMSTKFNGLTEESDPLLGNRAPLGDGRSTSNFTMPQEQAPPRCVPGLPQFVRVRAGAYFFMPGIRALRYFGKAGDSQEEA
jgi:deferrochelatase/peroxidase EfeB